ncbi:aspartate carbamoyltransferase catalytic subunit [Parvularcula maris]|uniref:Aspartate carbamoyltransferase n=1 Tax=Parvularcula maris TaxID=2965077 RepID=A0A9X2LBA0_9PROT|nr:aspartate carbamoyltransferase catalytic subunit [Parvularcula maris]MCQ8186559.1 aspartate carbamoyltransferase catalytic subunit [Parvularcula maris]
MRHLTDIGAMNDDTVKEILTRALEFDAKLRGEEALPQLLDDLIQLNVFYEPSTRTTFSFHIAGRRLGADVMTLPVENSSVVKGESLRDTVQTVAAQGVDLLVLRAPGAGTIDAAKSALKAMGAGTAILNAGEGAFGHPTQALLDAATLLKAHHRELAGGLEGLTVAIVGDLYHSRVAASTAPLFKRMGAEVRLCAPEDLLPSKKLSEQVDLTTTSRDEALDGADVVMALRIQTERFGDELPIDPALYRADYGLSMEALSFAKPTAFIMHPGPINRGIEIDSDVAEDTSRSLILSQVEMGVPTRMACLAWAAER